MLTGCAIAAGVFLLLAVGLAAGLFFTRIARTSSDPFSPSVPLVSIQAAGTPTPYPTRRSYSTALPYNTSTPYPTALPYPTTGPMSTPTPIDAPYQVIVRPSFFSGCSLTVKNQFPDLDGVVVLANHDSQVVVLAVYVRANDSVSTSGIDTGSYDTFVTLGTDWDALAGRFLNNSVYFRFKEPNVFDTCPGGFSGASYQYLDVTLNYTEGSGSDSIDILPDDFPRLAP